MASAGVKNAWSYASAPLTHTHDVVLWHIKQTHMA